MSTCACNTNNNNAGNNRSQPPNKTLFILK